MTTITHTPKISHYLAKIHDVKRWRYRHRCTCGVKSPERDDIRDAEADQRAHAREVGAS